MMVQKDKHLGIPVTRDTIISPSMTENNVNYI